jgi:hypothetical protein
VHTHGGSRDPRHLHAAQALQTAFRMKGVVFNLLEAFVVQTFGDEAWEAVLEKSGHAGSVWVGPGTYPDEHLMAVAGVAAQHAGLPLKTAVRAFGKFSFGGLGRRHPDIVARFADPVSMLEGIESVIHVEVRKLMPEAVTPRILAERRPDGRLAVSYESRRGLCALLEGLLEGMGDHYGVNVTLEKSACQHDGAARCEYLVSFSARQQAA